MAPTAIASRKVGQGSPEGKGNKSSSNIHLATTVQLIPVRAQELKQLLKPDCIGYYVHPNF